MEELRIKRNNTKEGIYKELIPQIESLISGEKNLIANLANVSAAIKEAFGLFWVGWYLTCENIDSIYKNNTHKELVLGPFQGPIACTRIKYGKGVCGKAWEKGETIIVPDVNEFPGHIACNSLSRSEIVVPLFSKGKITGVLDIDSDKKDYFDECDALYLEKITSMLGSADSR